jgi:phenylacetate-coenzyme A ligase PaaK-like adenylate-forming protein
MSSGHWGLGYLLGVPCRTRLSRRRMDALRDRRLKWLVHHAARTIPFYRELLEHAGVDPHSINGFDDLERLPVITRGALRDAGERAWAQDLPPERRIVASTSGSSGHPLALVFRFADRLRKHAIGLHCMSLYGWRPWHRGMALGSQALPHGHRLGRLGLCRWAWVDPSRPVSEWLTEYDRVRPHAFHSYPSALREFCFEARQRGPLAWIPRVLSVGGELCSAELKPLVAEVFGRPPLVMYGAVEGGRLAFECREHRGLHVRPDAVHVEILNDGRPAGPGEPGSVVITSLINTAMPIIRYELGDLAAWEPGECPCGLWWPRLTLHQGRQSEVIPLPGGRRVPVTRLGAVVGKSRSVRQFQFVRRADDVLLLRYEPYGEADDPLEHVLDQLRKALPGVDVQLERSGQLPRTATGKVTRYIDEAGAAQEESKAR